MTADVWAELAPSVLADQLAADLKTLVETYEDSRPRSQQQAIGPSGIGSPCTRCLARQVLGCPLPRGYDPHTWRRVVGTAVHAWLAEAALHHNVSGNRARYVIESRVFPDGEESDLLPKGGDSDLYDEDTGTVIDFKTASFNRLKKYRAEGPGQQYKFQAHLYGRGFQLLGKPVKNVALAFMPREGSLKDIFVWTEPYDEQVALTALERFRTIRALALSTGKAILPALPADPECFDCGGADVTDEELS